MNNLACGVTAAPPVPGEATMREENYWKRALRTPVTRRRTLALGLAGGILIACGDDDDDGKQGNGGGDGKLPPGFEPVPPGISKTLVDYRKKYSSYRFADLAGQADGPQSGGTFRYSTYPGVTGWDVTGPEGDTLASFASAHFNGLLTFRMNDKENPDNLYPAVGDLAQSWEQKDDLTVSFKLHQGVKFHDTAPVSGRELTSEDVAYCFKVYQGTQDPTKGIAQQPIFSEVDKIETPDKHTVVVKFKAPAAYFLNSLMYPVAVIFAKEAFEKPDIFKKTPIGTGAFVLDKWDPPNVHSGKKNPTYFRKDPVSGKQLPFVDAFEAPMLLGNHPQEVAQFRSGNLDTLWVQGKTELDNVVGSVSGALGQVEIPPPGFQPYMVLKLDKPPLNDRRVRRALQMAIDINGIIDSVAEGLGAPGYAQDYSYFGRNWPWSIEELDKLGAAHKYNVDEAKKLLKEATGAEKGMGRPLKVMVSTIPSTGTDVAKLMIGYWRNAGIDVVLDEYGVQDLTRWSTALFAKQWGDLDGVFAGFAGPGMDPDQYAYGPLNSKSPRNFFWVNDPKLDKLTVDQRRLFKEEERRKALEEVMKIDLGEAYRIWGVNPYKLSARQPWAFNVLDTIHAWSNVGWGQKSNEVVWINQKLKKA